MDRIVQQFKQGWKTTEFWVTLATGGILLVEATTGLDLDNEGLIALVGTNASYVLSRGFVKGRRVAALAHTADLVEDEPEGVRTA
jgi:hypothetical protein